jgi:hypothetical protein
MRLKEGRRRRLGVPVIIVQKRPLFQPEAGPGTNPEAAPNPFFQKNTHFFVDDRFVRRRNFKRIHALATRNETCLFK